MANDAPVGNGGAFESGQDVMFFDRSPCVETYDLQAPPPPEALPPLEEVERDCFCEVPCGEDFDQEGVGRKPCKDDADPFHPSGMFEAELDRVLRDARAKILRASGWQKDGHQQGGPAKHPKSSGFADSFRPGGGGTGRSCPRIGSSGILEDSKACRTSMVPGDPSSSDKSRPSEVAMKTTWGRQATPWASAASMNCQRGPRARAIDVDRQRCLDQERFVRMRSLSLERKGQGLGAQVRFERQRSPDSQVSADRKRGRFGRPGGLRPAEKSEDQPPEESSSPDDLGRDPSMLQDIVQSVRSGPETDQLKDARKEDKRTLRQKAAGVVGHPRWEGMMGVIIVSSIVSIGLSADIDREWGGWLLVEASFALIFAIDIILKVTSSGFHAFFRSAPVVYLNWLDFVLVLLQVAEVMLSVSAISSEHSSNFVLSMRTLRLLRVARTLRLVRFHVFNDLIMLIDGAQGGLRTLIWSQMLIAVVLYVISLIFREVLGDQSDSEVSQYFSSLTESYFTVFRCLIAGDCNNEDGKPIFVIVAREHGWECAIIYCIASVFMTFGLFNVIAAIYVENTVSAARCNQLRLKQARITNRRMFESKSSELLDFILQSGVATRGARHSLKQTSYSDLKHISITAEMLDTLLSETQFQEILRDLDVADEDQLDLFDTLDVDGSGQVDLDELVQAISKLRGDARRSDIVSVGLMVRNLQSSMNQLESHIKESASKAPEVSLQLRNSEFLSAEPFVACQV